MPVATQLLVANDSILLNTEPLSIESVVKTFLDGVGYKPAPWTLNRRLEEVVLARAKSSGIEYESDAYKVKMLHVAIATADLTSFHHTFEAQAHIAMYTWLSFMIDDYTGRMGQDVQDFQRRFFQGIPQPTPLLQRYSETLQGMYEFYDPIIASFIIHSSLAFVSCCVLETRADYRKMRPSCGGENWAYYFRNKEGIADAYALFNFTKDNCPDVSSFLQAVPDIGIFINLGNDILSFYKEELAGERHNYIHTRARYEKKAPLQVLKEVVDEAVAAHSRASLVLRGQGNSERAWHTYAHGYITMHKATVRYKLAELGLGETLRK